MTTSWQYIYIQLVTDEVNETEQRKSLLQGVRYRIRVAWDHERETSISAVVAEVHAVTELLPVAFIIHQFYRNR